jgi:2-methylcitrate dehydratase PrpD
MQSNISDKFLSGIKSLTEQPLTDSAKLHARRCLLDYLGATIAGASLAKKSLRDLMSNLGGLEATASVIGMDCEASLTTAALINGIASHTAELDDGVISGIIHPGTPVFSALLPDAQRNRISGDDLLLGIVAGYEGSVRIANAIQPSHKLRGYHATATCGSIGAAIGILTMSRADSAMIKNALSAAVVSASGSLKVLEDNSVLKPFNAGHAAVTAITAVALARSGFTGPNDAFEGNAGFLSMMADTWEPAELFGTAGRGLAIEQVYFKPYAACRYCHPAIEAAIVLRNEQGFIPQQISGIRVSTYKLAVRNHDHTTVESVSSAKMSIPFSVAIALDQGAAGINQYTDDTISSASIDHLMKMVEVQADEKFTAAFPKQTSARVEITMADGSTFEAVVHEAKGDPGNPLTDDEVSDKFMNLADFSGMSRERPAAIRDAVWNLPSDACKLYDLL